MASLSLKHIYKVYPNGNRAVSDFSMEIEDKEFIVFVGPSGCGKSTTLRMIAGLEDISSGELYIDGMLVNDMEPKDRDIAMVFQNYALYPHISVYENMAFGLKIRKLPNEEIHRRVVEAAEILGITDYLDKKPKEMSGGQRQRVALGRAIVREPKVFLLDEPLSNLDAKLRTQMRSEISKLHARLKTTFIYVTHDQTEAMTMGTRIVVMKGGFIEQIDTPRNLYNAPSSKFVAGFIGTPQMNFYDATLKKEGDTVTLSLLDIGLSFPLPYSEFLKVRKGFLTGEKRIIFGIRAERLIPLTTKEIPENGILMHCTVSHVEGLGDEALVYGDLAGNTENLTETRTGIVFKVEAEKGNEIRSGDVIPLTFGLRYAHFFDGETEKSIRPELPETNEVECNSDGKMFTMLGIRFPRPDAFKKLPAGRFTVHIPIDAIKKGETGKFSVSECSLVGGVRLSRLSFGDYTLFAAGEDFECGDVTGIKIDWKRVRFFDGEICIREAMPETSPLYGSIVRDTVKRKAEDGKGAGRSKKSVLYSFDIAGVKHEIPDEILERLLKTVGISVLHKKLRYEIPPDAVTIGHGEITAHVLDTLDFGDEIYSVLSVGGRRVIARSDGTLEGSVKLLLDLFRVTYVDDELDVIL